MTEHAVVIAGGGPTGLMLAGELALAGIDVVIVERRANQDLDSSRSGGLHSRTIEVLDQRGIADRFLVGGAGCRSRLRRIPLDISDFPTRHNYGLALWQSHFERILAGWVGELGVPIAPRAARWWASRRTTPASTSSCPAATSLRAEYLVGCDGGRSRDPQGGRHRLPRVGSLDELDDRRGRDGRGAGVRRATRGRWHRSGQPGGGRRSVRGRAEGTAGRTRRRARPCADLREALVAAVRDGLRAAQPDLDLPVHRHDAPGGVLPPAAASCSRATPRTCIPRRVARASTPACRMP